MKDIASDAWRRFLIQLQVHPLRTKAITASVVTGCSDLMSQKFSGIKKLQYRRLLLMMLYGFAYGGPFGHFFHKTMDKIFKGKKGSKTIALKLLVEQLIISPWNTILYMTYYGSVIEGKPWNLVMGKVKKDYPSLQLAAWKFWPIAGFVNHRFIPLQFRVFFSSFVALFWGVFLNLRARSITAKKD